MNHLTLKFAASTFAASLLLCGSFGQATAADTVGSSAAPEYLRWPVPAADKKYGSIDGKHIWQYVAEQAEIAEHYRDNGHPQFWGRLAGTSGDDADAQWLLNKYRQIGLTDTRLQTVNYYNPQWSAQSWGITVAAANKTVQITSAEPSYGSPDTAGKELDLPVVYVGLGSEADFAGRDVRGKAILFVKGQSS